MKHIANYALATVFLLVISGTVTADSENTSPLAIQDSELWEITVIDQSTLSPNGNLTVSNGDYVSISVEVYSDVNHQINGSWEFKFLSGGIWQNSAIQNVSWLPNETKNLQATIGPFTEAHPQ